MRQITNNECIFDCTRELWGYYDLLLLVKGCLNGSFYHQAGISALFSEKFVPSFPRSSCLYEIRPLLMDLSI